MEDTVSAVVVFLLLWWWFFLMALPIGVRVPDSIGEGHAASAPRRPHIRKKAVGATIAALLGTLIVDYLIGAELFSFRDAVQGW